MKTITVRQPWAAAIVSGVKKYETRPWRTHYRGPLLIHAGKAVVEDPGVQTLAAYVWKGIPSLMIRGAIVGRVTLTDVIRAEDARPQGLEALIGDFTEGRWAWVLTEAEIFWTPIPARGQLGLWEFEGAVP